MKQKKTTHRINKKILARLSLIFLNPYAVIFFCFCILESESHSHSESLSSTIEQRVSFNSENQKGYHLSSIFGISNALYLGGIVNLIQAKNSSLENPYTLLGAFSAGHAQENLGFDAKIEILHQTDSKILSYGGSLAATYYGQSHIPQDEPDTITKPQKEVLITPLYWVRLAFTGRNATSILNNRTQKGNVTLFNLDSFYQWSSKFILGLGIESQKIYNPESFFTLALKNATNASNHMIGISIPYLSQFKLAPQVNLILNPQDVMVAQYQFQIMDKTNRIGHLLNLSWRHQFQTQTDLHFSIEPTYEIAQYNEHIFNAISLGFNINF